MMIQMVMDSGILIQMDLNSNGILLIMSRDYKDEYKKFQKHKSSYRAKLNKYNREKGTYGNGDNKDASHKNGKIVGFVESSTNKGKKEKSRRKGSKRKSFDARKRSRVSYA